MENPSLYMTIVTWAFLITNGVRVLAYVPTITRLVKRDCSADGQSQLTWVLWTVSNATFTLHLFEQHQRQIDEAVLFCAANVVMNLVVLLLVRKVHTAPARSRGRSSAEG